MSEKRTPSRGRRIGMLAGFVIALALLILLIVLLSRSGAERKKQAAAVSAGVEYLQSLEEKDTSAVEETLKAMRQEEIAAQREQRIQALVSGETDVWSQFEDYVLLGDSRAVGFWWASTIISACHKAGSLPPAALPFGTWQRTWKKSGRSTRRPCSSASA